MTGSLPLLALAFAALALDAAAQPPEMAFDGKVAWHCGGVGADARQAMQSLEPQSNLRLVFVTARRGGYLADATLRIDDGKDEVLRAESVGPVCLLRLLPGRYRVRAERGGVLRESRVTIGAQAGRPATVAMAFPGEPWDGIWTSPEEKRQAGR
jgi:hypothetical protein